MKIGFMYLGPIIHRSNKAHILIIRISHFCTRCTLHYFEFDMFLHFQLYHSAKFSCLIIEQR